MLDPARGSHGIGWNEGDCSLTLTSGTSTLEASGVHKSRGVVPSDLGST